jgi:hypothetical protein
MLWIKERNTKSMVDEEQTARLVPVFTLLWHQLRMPFFVVEKNQTLYVLSSIDILPFSLWHSDEEDNKNLDVLGRMHRQGLLSQKTDYAALHLHRLIYSILLLCFVVVVSFGSIAGFCGYCRTVIHPAGTNHKNHHDNDSPNHQRKSEQMNATIRGFRGESTAGVRL